VAVAGCYAPGGAETDRRSSPIFPLAVHGEMNRSLDAGWAGSSFKVAFQNFSLGTLKDW